MWDNQILQKIVVPKFYAKMYEKIAKIRLSKKCNNFWINKDMSIKIEYDNFKANKYVILKFQVRIFQHILEINNQRASWSDRTGSSRPGSLRI